MQVYCSKIDKFKNNKNAYHENIDFYNRSCTTHMKRRHFGSLINKNSRLLKIYIQQPKHFRL
jgi:hypothetical protein